MDTILPRDDLPENIKEMPEIGQRVRLSKGDIAQTMALYGCPGENVHVLMQNSSTKKTINGCHTCKHPSKSK